MYKSVFFLLFTYRTNRGRRLTFELSYIQNSNWFRIFSDYLISMVKYGMCSVKCTKCGKGCEVKTQIQRDAGWDTSITTQECDHGKMSIDMFTRNSFMPWGDPDEIKFRVNFIFNGDGKQETTFTREFSRTGCDDGDEKDSKGCALAEAHFSGNGFTDYFKNTVGAGVMGVFIGQFYETRRFG